MIKIKVLKKSYILDLTKPTLINNMQNILVLVITRNLIFSWLKNVIYLTFTGLLLETNFIFNRFKISIKNKEHYLNT